jgi:tetratricopeptide (TPR) repeat protein
LSAGSVKRRKTKLVLALIVAIYGSLLLAQSTTQAEDSLSENYPHQQDQTDEANIIWPLLSGESVANLATLFYPKNQKMQRLFVTKTLQLNHVVYPDLVASSKSNQASLIVIPNIKSLSKYSGDTKFASLASAKRSTRSMLHKSYDPKDVARSAFNPSMQDLRMQVAYDELLKKNELLKQELDNLNAELVRSQDMLAALNIDVERVQSRTLPLPATTSESVEKAQNNHTQDDVINNSLAKTSVSKAVKTVANDVHNKVLAKPVLGPEAEKSSSNSQYLIMLIILLIAAIGLFFSFRFYKRWQTKNLSLIATDGLSTLAKTKSFSDTHRASSFTSSLNSADASQMVSEASGILMDEDLDSTKVLHDKEEGELVLEQARIYANLNREDEAIALLKAQIQSAPKTALHHWLYLLDLYRATNQKEAFLQCAATLHQQFNVMVPLWSDAPAAMVVAASLEAFPHIVENLTNLWADSEKVNEKLAETKAYLDQLLTDNRDGERTGFGPEVFQEVLFLRSLLDVREKLGHED